MPKKPRKKPKPSPKSAAPPSPSLPLWAPDDLDSEHIPPEVQQAVSQVIQPVYERLVSNCDDPLEKSLGVTIAHLLWLEILQQADLKREYYEVKAVLGLDADYQQYIDQHLRIIESKVKVGYLLTHIREFRHRWNQHPPDHPCLPNSPPAIEANLPPAQIPDTDYNSDSPSTLTYP